MGSKEFNEKAIKKYEKLDELYSEKYAEVYGEPDALLLERGGMKYVEDLAAGDYSVADDSIEYLNAADINLNVKGVREELDGIEGRVAIWTDAAGEAFYDYIGKAQTATDNQVELIRVLNALQQGHRELIIRSRQDALVILDTAIEEMEKVTTETKVNKVDLTLAVTGSALSMVSGVLGFAGGETPGDKVGSAFGLASDVVNAVRGVKASFDTVLKGGDPNAIYDSVPLAMKTLKKSTKAEVKGIKAGLEALNDQVNEYWEYYVPPPPNLQIARKECVPSRKSLAA